MWREAAEMNEFFPSSVGSGVLFTRFSESLNLTHTMTSSKHRFTFAEMK